MDWSVWGLPLLSIVAGAAFGLFVIGRNAARDASIAVETRRIDLESTREDMVDALKQLEFDKDKMSPQEYAEERRTLLARGAKALAALEGEHGPTAEPQVERPPQPVKEAAGAKPAAPAGGGLAPEWRGALSALAVVTVLFLLWQYATSETVERRDGASMTGNQSLGVPDDPQDPTKAFRESQQFKDELAAVQAAITANPLDVAALNKGTHLQLNAGDPAAAMDFNTKALDAAPTDAEARTYRAILTAMMGMEEKALEQLDAVLVDNPDFSRAVIFRAMILSHLQRPQEGLAALEAAAARRPEDAELQQALSGFRQAVASAGPGGPPPGGPPSAGGELLVSGVVQLDPASAGALTGGETLFVSVADPARPGPPVAADKRAGPLRFPMPFELTTAHIRAMPGAGGVPETMDLKIRVDLDGNAMTVEPDAPAAKVTGVHKGQSGLTVTMSLGGAPVAAPPMPAGAPAGGGLLAPVAPVAATGGGGDVLAAGTAELDPKRTVTGAEIVFVSVKDPSGGPPLAVSRVPAKFPLAFRVTSADVIPMMAGRPMPDTINVSIRVDQDGNATTKNGEPEGLLPGVKRGSDQLQITLQ
ncbi:MAG: hypothetical protein ABMA64_07590 [Myxococcota bacterium]